MQVALLAKRNLVLKFVLGEFNVTEAALGKYREPRDTEVQPTGGEATGSHEKRREATTSDDKGTKANPTPYEKREFNSTIITFTLPKIVTL